MKKQCSPNDCSTDRNCGMNKMIKSWLNVQKSVLLLLLAGFCLPSWSQSTSIVVTSTANEGTGSLRQAISDVADGGTITFDPIEFGTKQTITLGTTLTINKDLTIDGAGKVVIDGGNTFTADGVSNNNGVQIMNIASGKKVTLSNLTFQNGYVSVDGGAIANAGTLTVNHSTFANNTATSGGGAIRNHNNAKLIIENSVFKGNYAGANGGAIFNNEKKGTVVISNSVIANNSAITAGGAINNTYGTLIVLNSTITGNSIKANKEQGGAIWSASGNAYILNSIVVGNSYTTGIDDVSTDSSNKTYTMNLVEGEESGKTIADVFNTDDGKVVLGDDGRIEIKKDGPAWRSGSFVWKNADYTHIAYSTDRLGDSKMLFLGADASLANTLIETDITGKERQNADIGACSKIIQGAEANYPLFINNETDLQTLRDGINTGEAFTYKGDSVPAGGEGIHFKLTADLDLSSVCGASVGSGTSWIPIGDNLAQFKGHFHGGGHSISNLYINASTSNYQGLFGYVEGGSIDSLNLVNTNVTGRDYVGGVCGYNNNYSEISHCLNSGSVSGRKNIGGVCGYSYNNSTISYCSNSGSVSGNSNVGGVCGYNNNYSEISHCLNSGSVSGIENYVGGVCGYNNNNSEINHCLNSGSVSGTKNYVGGVCGYNNVNSEISHCLNSGSVSGNGNVGGVCGMNMNLSKISNCLNSGSVSGTESNVGGVSGYNDGSTIINCYYDKQMCTVGGINGSDVPDQAEGKLTTEMMGASPTGITDFTATDWAFADGLYPRSKGIENSDAAIVAATPIFLKYDTDSYETVNSVATNFTVGTGNGVTWEIDGNGIALTVLGENVTIVTCGNDTLVAKRNNIIYKTVALKVPYSPTHPYSIDNVADLQDFREGINSGASFTYKGNSVPAGGVGVHFKLTADLDLSSVCGASVNGSEVNWTPIGKNTNQFKGHFHGGGHSISNLYINAPTSDYQGLFGYTNGGSIDNLNLVNTNVTGKDYVGGVCGYNYNNSEISHCINIGSVSGNQSVGGVCGYNYNNSEISHCLNSGSVSGSSNIGGVCGHGYNNSIISHCSNSGSVSGNGNVGGVCGYNNNNSEISHCLNSGSVSGTESNVGGVCGCNNDYSEISHCLNSGSGSGNGNVGGVCGYNYNNSEISYCFNSVSVSGSSIVGGVCGWSYNSEISHCFNIGSVSGSGIVGGVSGYNDGSTIINCYYDKQLCAVGGVGGSDVAGQAEGKLTTEMIGTALQSLLGTYNWIFAEGMYPHPIGVENTDAALVAATPIFLAATNDSIYETVNNVDANFTVGTGNGVTWETYGNGTSLTVSGSTVAVGTYGNDTLVAKKNGIIHKTVALKVPNSQAHPLTIDSIADLQAFRDGINSGAAFTYKGYLVPADGANIYFKLTADLDMSSVCGVNVGSGTSWTPIGNSLNRFMGHFHCGGHTISNLYINASTSNYQGLFGYVEGGSIDSLNLINTNITAQHFVGGVCGWNGSTISHCVNSGNVSGSNYVGGVCGYNYNNSEISHCVNSGNVSGSNYVGGVCGYNYNNSEISHCINIGSVSGNQSVGGVCGQSYNFEISHCINIGSVSGNQSVGGVCGKNENSAINNCYYDKQLCAVGGINDIDVAGQAEGKLTTEMVGTALQQVLGTDNWIFAEGMYPRVKNGAENTDAILVAATPIFLAATNDSIYETVNNVDANFTVGTGNGVTWETYGNGTSLTVSGSTVAVGICGNDTLVAKKNGIIYKTVALKVPSSWTRPLTIDSIADLQVLRDSINRGSAFTYKGYLVPAGGANTYFKLSTDLDMSSVCGANVNENEVSWTPIGNNTNRFKGHFHGGGHTISNLYINAPESDCQGLFCYVRDGSIDSLNLENTNITAKNIVGGVCGKNYNSTISHCVNSGNVSGSSFVGGVCGQSYNSELSNCFNSGNVSGSSYVGGVVGNNDNATISHCINIGSVSGNTDVGGVCGKNENSAINNCYYDKQLCAVGGINDIDVAGQAEGKLTTEMVGTALQQVLGTDNWIFAEGMYPRVKNGAENTDAILVAATPIFLAATNDSIYETVNNVDANFTVGTGNGVTWETYGNGTSLTVSGSTVAVGICGNDTLVIKKDGIIYKTVALKVPYSPTHPYSIDNVADLQALCDSINSGSAFTYKGYPVPAGGEDAYFKLTSDLDMSSVCGDGVGNWTPIGNISNQFKGHFHGGGHTISNLYINAPESNYQGLFGIVESGSIDSLNLINTNITAQDYVGSVCGDNNYSEISNCFNLGSVIGRLIVGGVCGENYNSTMSFCVNIGSVSGNQNVGGVCGYSDNSTINSCANIGDVSGVGFFVGGVCGEKYNSTISNCYYDKQLCPVGGIRGIDVAGQAEGKLTTEMTGTALQQVLDADNWTFAEGMYPRVKNGAENTDAVLVAATPIFLAVTNDSIYETVNSVEANFTVGTDNGVIWETYGKGTSLSVLGENVTHVGYGNDTLVAEKNGIIYKTIVLFASNSHNPFTIDNVTDLQTLRDSINSGKSFTYKGNPMPAGGANTYFKLTSDLDLSSVCGASAGNWTPIGNNSNRFKGHFHGGGHIISNLYINAPESNYQGLFGYVEVGSIDSLNLVNTNIAAQNYVGSVCGVNNNSPINHCTNFGSLSGNQNVGGMCGYIGNTAISNCVNSGSVSGNDYVGGVCGGNDNNSTIINCVNSGSVSGNTDVGGVCGYISNVTMSNCFNTGSVSGNEAVGGVCGNVYISSTFSNCYYDKQLCTVGGIDSSDVVGQAEGKLTTAMTGTALQSVLGTDNWIFAEGMYPRPKGVENTDAALVAATPIFLLNEETVAEVKSDFSVGALVGATWSASPDGCLQFEGTNAIIKSNGAVEVTVTKNAVSKTIKLTLNKQLDGISTPGTTENNISLVNTTEGFFIDLGAEKYTVNLYTIGGKLLITRTVIGSSYFDLSSYASGIYLVRVNNRVFKVMNR